MSRKPKITAKERTKTIMHLSARRDELEELPLQELCDYMRDNIGVETCPSTCRRIREELGWKNRRILRHEKAAAVRLEKEKRRREREAKKKAREAPPAPATSPGVARSELKALEVSLNIQREVIRNLTERVKYLETELGVYTPRVATTGPSKLQPVGA
jgi:hypothetical protein